MQIPQMNGSMLYITLKRKKKEKNQNQAVRKQFETQYILCETFKWK